MCIDGQSIMNWIVDTHVRVHDSSLGALAVICFAVPVVYDRVQDHRNRFDSNEGMLD